MLNRLGYVFITCIIIFIVVRCTSSERQKARLFTSMTANHTGIDFENNLPFDKDFNIYTYRNYYNGGGVGLGDINNDDS